VSSPAPPRASPPAGTPGRELIDPAALMKIRSLELRARVVVEGLWRGLHRSPYHGFSVEFTEYRPYSPGDDVRTLDWRLYARTDRDYVKRFEDETNLRCQLVVDHSRSMSFSSASPSGAGAAPSKADYAATLAATFASFLFAQGDAVGVTTFAGAAPGSVVKDHLPARNRPGHLRRLMLLLDRPPDGRHSAVGAALDEVARLQRRRGMVVLISDLLLPAAECERPLAALRAAGHEVLVLQVLDPQERTLALAGPARLRDLETDAVLDVDPRAAGERYRRAMEAHIEELRRMCARLGIERHLLLTDTPLDRALLAVVGERAARARRRR
jgi:uncharacterized protein (DUF58 family)